MSVQPQSLEAAVGQFAEPTLDGLRPALVKIWKSGFADQTLAAGMLENPRLSTRIVSEICAAQGQTRVVEVPSIAIRNTIGALLMYGETEFAKLLGCVWFRQTILDWVTWNALAEHMPGADLAAVRRAIVAVPPEEAEAAGAPTEAVEALTESDVVAQGLACLSAWRCSLPTALAQRLTLFLNSPAKVKDPNRAELVTLLSHKLVEVAT